MSLSNPVLFVGVNEKGSSGPKYDPSFFKVDETKMNIYLSTSLLLFNEISSKNF